MFEQITSFQNTKIKLANKLVNKRQREQTGLFVVDYARDLERALAQNYMAEFAFFCPSLSTEDEARLAHMLQCPVYEVSAELLEKASYRQNPGGLVAIVKQKPALGIEDALKREDHCVLGLVNLTKPGNIGALLRTADASGFTMICLIDTALDRYNPNIIRSSTGTVFLDNVFELTSAEAIHYFQSKSIQIVAAHLDGTTDFYGVDFVKQRSAVILGTEDIGLDDHWVSQCDSLVKIPMVGSVSDSLNVSVSGAIFMYEALRQRHLFASNL